MNSGYTRFNELEELANAGDTVRKANRIAERDRNRYVSQLREVAGNNENLFTAIIMFGSCELGDAECHN